MWREMKNKTIIIFAVLNIFFAVIIAKEIGAIPPPDGQPVLKSPGEPCFLNSECSSGYCRADYSGGKYCAKSSTSCVHKIGSIVHQYSNGQRAPDCCSSQQERKCRLGNWKCYSCGTYKECSGGRCVYVDDDGDGVLDYKDKCPNTPPGCTVSNGKIDSSTGCPKNPFDFYIKNDISESCPLSSIPVDPYNAGCLSSSDASTHMTLKIGNYVANSDCDPISGTEGWHDIEDGRNYCEFKIPEISPGSYNLHAVYNLNGVSYDQVFKTGFQVKSECSTSTPCSHGGRVTTSPTANLEFSPSCVLKGDKYICRLGTKLSLKNIASYESVCSNGVHANAGPVCIVAWLYSGSVFKTKTDNKCAGCPSPSVPVPMKYRSDLLQETSGLKWSCDINWHPSGENKIDEIYTFDKPTDAGFYTLYIDYINAVCDSPDYVCPTSGTLCKIGSMSSDYKGFENMKTYKIAVIDPVLEITEKPETPVEEFLDKENKEITLIWKVKNVGVGDADVNVNPVCDSDLNCKITSFASGIIEQDKTATIIMKLNLPCNSDNFQKSAGISIEYTDTYGFYTTPKKLEDSVTISVEVPKPDLTFENLGSFLHYDWEPEEKEIKWKIINTGVGGVKITNVEVICPSKFVCGMPEYQNIIDNGGVGSASEKINVSEFMLPNITVTEYYSASVTPKQINISYLINLKHIYDEDYGLSCIVSKEKTNKYPFTIIKTCDNESYFFEQIVNIEGNYTIGNESITLKNQTYYCITEGWNITPFSNNTPDNHCYDVDFGDKNDNDIDCCKESNNNWLFDALSFENGTNPYCCGDDSGEYYRLSNIDGSEACCNSQNDCVFNGTCYPSDNWYYFNGKNYYCAPGDGKWYQHPICELKVSDLIAVIGREYTVKAIIRNVQEKKDTLKLNLTGYSGVRFAENGKTTLELELDSGEERELNIVITASDLKPHKIYLNGQSSVNPSLTDFDKINLRGGYPESFSGLKENFMLLLISLSVLIYYFIKIKK